MRKSMAYLWSTLIPLLFASGCWHGEPKVPIDPAYAECKRTCNGVCAADGQCLPAEYPK
jgi:hypothetical protein